MIFIATKQKLSFLENSLFETYRVFDYTHYREGEFFRPLITLIFYCITLSPVLEMWLNLAEPLSQLIVIIAGNVQKFHLV